MNGYNWLIKLVMVLVALAQSLSLGAQDLKLVWSDEFDCFGRPDESKWCYEEGFLRNREDQWYQRDNAFCADGLLVIEGRKEHKPNPMYVKGSSDWRCSREYIEYTSSCITTSHKMSFAYGRLEVRARIPVGKGAWPAIWLLSDDLPWPDGGEIDVMEFYRYRGVPSVLANACWRSEDPNNPNWNTCAYPISKWTDIYPEWPTEFHVWRMDWDDKYIRIYLDDELLNETDLSGTVNDAGPHKGLNPFKKPMYILLNLALGGSGGLDIKDEALPMRYEVDYVRVYSK